MFKDEGLGKIKRNNPLVEKGEADPEKTKILTFRNQHPSGESGSIFGLTNQWRDVTLSHLFTKN